MVTLYFISFYPLPFYHCCGFSQSLLVQRPLKTSNSGTKYNYIQQKWYHLLNGSRCWDFASIPFGFCGCDDVYAYVVLNPLFYLLLGHLFSKMETTFVDVFDWEMSLNLLIHNCNWGSCVSIVRDYYGGRFYERSSLSYYKNDWLFSTVVVKVLIEPSS